MPTFSVDGKMLVFNDVATGRDGEGTPSVMDFDCATGTQQQARNFATRWSIQPGLSSYRTSSSAEKRQMAPAVISRWTNNTGDWRHLSYTLGRKSVVGRPSTNKALPLDHANGRDKGMIYLPYGEPEANKNFVPTVSPIAAGGYYWCFSPANATTATFESTPTGSTVRKKDWVTAVDIDAPPESDPSHPAFYLSNQENESGNIRAFAALEPCRVEGESCSSGVDCCCGFCATKSGTGTCDCHPNRCSNIEEKCTTAADCCDPGVACVGGFCQYIVE
jgi:hypothetical protein